jgi:hypothetical protein
MDRSMKGAGFGLPFLLGAPSMNVVLAVKVRPIAGALPESARLLFGVDVVHAIWHFDVAGTIEPAQV